MTQLTLIRAVNDDILYEPAYTIAQAAGLTGTHPQTVRGWLLGYDKPYRQMEPVFGPGPRSRNTEDDEAPTLLSFIEMIEMMVAQRFRSGEAALDIPNQKKRPMPLNRIRSAHKYARERLKIPYPFASEKLVNFGGHIMHEFEQGHPNIPEGSFARYIALDLGGNWALPTLVEQAFKNDFTYQEDAMVTEWFPLGPDQPVRVNPRVRGGQPTIVETGITVSAIASRVNRGENRKIVAKDYGISMAVIDAAIKASSEFKYSVV